MANLDTAGEVGMSKHFDAPGQTAEEMTESERRMRAEIADLESRARGRWMTRIGAVVTAATLLVAIVWDVGFGEDMPLAYVLPLYAFAIGAVGIGVLEKLSRPMRASQELLLRKVFGLEAGMRLLAELLPEELHTRFYKGVAYSVREGISATGTGRDNPYIGAGSNGGEVLEFRQRTGPRA
jgi:hypothetical protein